MRTRADRVLRLSCLSAWQPGTSGLISEVRTVPSLPRWRHSAKGIFYFPFLRPQCRGPKTAFWGPCHPGWPGAATNGKELGLLSEGTWRDSSQAWGAAKAGQEAASWRGVGTARDRASEG